MNDLQIIKEKVSSARNRWRSQAIWAAFWKGLFAGALLWIAALLAYKLLPLEESTPAVAFIPAALLCLAMTLAAFRRPPTLLDAARKLDLETRLKERLSTALELQASQPDHPWTRRLLADASRHARELSIATLLPWGLPPVARWVTLALFLGAIINLAPELRSAAAKDKRRDAVLIKEAGRQITDLTHRSLEQHRPALESTRMSLETVTNLAERLTHADLTRAEALKELAVVAEKLKQDFKPLGENPLLRRMEQAGRDPTRPPNPSSRDGSQRSSDALERALGNQADAAMEKLDQMARTMAELRKKAAELSEPNSKEAREAAEKIRSALAEMSRQAESMGLNLANLEAAASALESGRADRFLKALDRADMDIRKLQAMAKALQRMQERNQTPGRTLAEQLERGQPSAAAQTLRAMAKSLNSASPADLEKALQELQQALDPARDYGPVADLLQKAAKEGRAGDREGSARSMQAAAAALEEMLNQMADADDLMEAMDALTRAQLSVSSGMAWGQCANPGAGRKPGRGGRGVGTWTDEGRWELPDFLEEWDNSQIQRPDSDPRGLTDRGDGALKDNLDPSRLKNQIRPGGPMPSVTLRGVSIRGTSRATFTETSPAAQGDDQRAVDQEPVPRAYQGAVKDYFDDRKP